MRLSSKTAKVLATSLLLASTTGVAFAKNYKGETHYKDEAPCPPPAMLKTGWYLGAQVGYDSYRVRDSINGPGATDLSTSGVFNGTGWVGGLFLGYGQMLSDMFYLGGEIFGDISGVDDTVLSVSDPDEPLSASSKFEVNGSYGLALLPGIKLNDAPLGYIRLGWNWAKLNAKGTVTDDGVTVSNSKTNTSNGFNLGLGMETLLVDNWSVRTEYSHTWYNSFSSGAGTVNPSDNQYMLGVVYHFA
jgi:opacity protein-like surface antigen